MSLSCDRFVGYLLEIGIHCNNLERARRRSSCVPRPHVASPARTLPLVGYIIRGCTLLPSNCSCRIKHELLRATIAMRAERSRSVCVRAATVDSSPHHWPSLGEGFWRSARAWRTMVLVVWHVRMIGGRGSRRQMPSRAVEPRSSWSPHPGATIWGKERLDQIVAFLYSCRSFLSGVRSRECWGGSSTVSLSPSEPLIDWVRLRLGWGISFRRNRSESLIENPRCGRFLVRWSEI